MKTKYNAVLQVTNTPLHTIKTLLYKALFAYIRVIHLLVKFTDLAIRNTEKYAAAYALFMEDFPQNEIAKLLRIEESHLSRWSKQNDWNIKRNKAHLFREKSEESVQSLITYQLEVLVKIKELSEDSLKNAKTIAELEPLLIKRGDIDALQKLFVTIKDDKELDWKAKVKLLNRFAESISADNNDLAKQLTPFITQFLNDERTQDFKDR